MTLDEVPPRLYRRLRAQMTPSEQQRFDAVLSARYPALYAEVTR